MGPSDACFGFFLFTHIFIPVIFLLFFGLYSLKKRERFRLFIIMSCFYIAVLVYFTTYYLPQIVNAFLETVYGFGEYSETISQSFKATTSIFSQIISNINRIRVPLTLVFLGIGFLFSLFKKKMHYMLVILGVVGGLYLALGLVYSVLGLRALQVLIIALVTGVGFLLVRVKKPTMVLVTVLIILSIFGPLRGAYDQTQFILNEEENTCRFLALSVSSEKVSYIGVDQVDWGYITNIASYINKGHTFKVRSSSYLFYKIFNKNMINNNYVIYNSNLGKEIRDNGLIPNYREAIFTTLVLNNKVYNCGRTSILTG
jgi:hypothetical protein